MDDKKKVAVVGVLFVAMLAIGAFEFTKGGDEPAPKPKDGKTSGKGDGASAATAVDSKGGKDAKGGKESDKAEPVKNPLVALPLPQRDPFKPISLPNASPSPATTPPAPKPIAKPTPRQPRPNSLPMIPPVHVEDGPNPLGGQLPPAVGPLQGPVGGSQPVGEPVATFGYKLKGTLMGDRPMAVFADSQGNERIVPVGSSLDGDSQVVSVGPGMVKVRVHGKVMTLTPGGNE